MQYWIMKSEPDEFSIDDLAKKKIARWDGVRNYQVRNMFRDQMQVGDQAFFYHSSCEHIGIAGLMEINSAAYPDPAATDKKSKYYDQITLKKENPWLAVDVKFLQKFKTLLSRQQLAECKDLSQLIIFRKGSRLSVTPIEAREFKKIFELAKN